MSINQKSLRHMQQSTEMLFAATSIDSPALASVRPPLPIDVFVTEFGNFVPASLPQQDDLPQPVYLSDIDILQSKTSWTDREYRHIYASAAVEQGLAYQIRINRELRGMTQKELAKALKTKQSAVSRLEDPDYGKHSLQMLKKVASFLDCALIVKFAGFSKLARESQSLSEEHLFAPSYDDEISGQLWLHQK